MSDYKEYLVTFVRGDLPESLVGEVRLKRFPILALDIEQAVYELRERNKLGDGWVLEKIERFE